MSSRTTCRPRSSRPSRASTGSSPTSATSGSGVSTISASFAYGTDLARAEQKIQLAINRIQDSLPAAVDTQVVAFSLSDLPVVVLAVTSDLEADELSARLRDETIIDLANIPGVAEASLSGASGQRVTITPDTDELFANGLSNQAIRDALDANGVLLRDRGHRRRRPGAHGPGREHARVRG